MVNTAFDALVQRERLVGARNDDDDLASLQHGLHTHCQGHLGNLADVVVKESRVSYDSVVGESFDPRARSKTRAGLVEGNVSVWSDTPKEELDAASTPDLLLVSHALGLQIGRVAIQDVDVGGIDVDVGEKVLVHEAVVRLGVVAWQANIFVLQ